VGRRAFLDYDSFSDSELDEIESELIAYNDEADFVEAQVDAILSGDLRYDSKSDKSLYDSSSDAGLSELTASYNSESEQSYMNSEHEASYDSDSDEDK